MHLKILVHMYDEERQEVATVIEKGSKCSNFDSTPGRRVHVLWPTYHEAGWKGL